MNSPEFRQAMTSTSTSPPTSTDDCPEDPMLPFINASCFDEPTASPTMNINSPKDNGDCPKNPVLPFINFNGCNNPPAPSKMDLNYPEDILQQAMNMVRHPQSAISYKDNRLPENALHHNLPEDAIHHNIPEDAIHHDLPEDATNDRRPEDAVFGNHTEDALDDRHPEDAIYENLPEEAIDDRLPEYANHPSIIPINRPQPATFKFCDDDNIPEGVNSPPQDFFQRRVAAAYYLNDNGPENYTPPTMHFAQHPQTTTSSTNGILPDDIHHSSTDFIPRQQGATSHASDNLPQFAAFSPGDFFVRRQAANAYEYGNIAEDATPPRTDFGQRQQEAAACSSSDKCPGDAFPSPKKDYGQRPQAATYISNDNRPEYTSPAPMGFAQHTQTATYCSKGNLPVDAILSPMDYFQRHHYRRIDKCPGDAFPSPKKDYGQRHHGASYSSNDNYPEDTIPAPMSFVPSPQAANVYMDGHIVEDAQPSLMDFVQPPQAAVSSSSDKCPGDAFPSPKKDYGRRPRPLNPYSSGSIAEDASSAHPAEHPSMELVHCPDAAPFTSDETPLVEFAAIGGMKAKDFRGAARAALKDITTYFDILSSPDPEERVAVTADVEPGYLKELLPTSAPERGETWTAIKEDIAKKIMPGITHWQHPSFHAFFPCASNYPSILGELYSSFLSGSNFNWINSPAATELEVIVMDWLAQMLGLPNVFLSDSINGGGGVVLGSASEAILTCMIAAREKYIEERLSVSTIIYGNRQTAVHWLRGRMVVLGSSSTHSSTRKAAMILGFRYEEIPVDETDGYRLTGKKLVATLDSLKQGGLEPFFLTATMGTTDTCATDDFWGIAKALKMPRRPGMPEVWVHVDAAYAGAALILEDVRHKVKVDIMANFHSFNMNMNKWMLVNLDASCLFVRNRDWLIDALDVDQPVYGNHHSSSGKVVDYRQWQIPLSRRFRALKIWFVMRTYGVEGIRTYIQKTTALAERFARLIAQREDLFEILAQPAYALVVFGMVGKSSHLLDDKMAVNNELTTMFGHKINSSGRMWVTSTELNGRKAIRFMTAVSTTEVDDIDRAFHLVVNLAQYLKYELEVL